MFKGEKTRLLWLGLIVLGIILIAIILREFGSYERPLSVLLQSQQTLFAFVVFFCSIGGTAFIILGLLGIGRQYFKNHKNLFTMFTVILIPLLVYALITLAIALTPMYL